VLVVLAGMLMGASRSSAQGAAAAQGIPNAQSMQTPMGPGAPGTPAAARNGATISVTIVDENKKPLKQQSLIRLTSQATGRVLFQTTRGTDTNFPEISPGKYLLEVGAAGYLGTHVEITVPDVGHDVAETVILSRDPAAVDLSVKDAQLPPKARKEAEKGIQALELSNLAEARKHLEAANHQYPSSSSINLLLGYLALQQKDQEHELSYLTSATKLDPGNVQAQNLLGQLYYQRGDYALAAKAEEIVVASSGESLIARKVLANSCLKLKQFEEARENAQWLVDHGGDEGASARLVLGQALAGVQKYEAAIQVLTAYLDQAPASSVTPQVRALLAQLEKHVSPGAADAKAKLGIGDPELTADNESAGNAGMPTDVDAQKPFVAAGVQCPANILDGTANPTLELVDSVARFSAIEHMVHEKLSPRGVPSNRETRQYNYVASISEPAPDILMIEEFRDAGDLNMPDKIITTGLPVLAIAFHPHFRDDFEMHCEGLGDWEGQAAWLVHLRQLDDRPPRLRAYVVNGNNYPVRLKGRAWVRADNFQIVHLETDLVRPIPEIRLFTEHTSVSYGPVQFKRSGTDLWLPKSAELYVHFAKQRFHRSENFDHFMLFATDAVGTAKLPKTDPTPTPAADHGAAQPQ
jgi:tetratricopeptide (TPR) repeat protein